MDVIWMLVAIALITHYRQVHSTDDSIYSSQLNKCLETINDIPANISAPLKIKRAKNHIELVVNYGQIDYYEMDWRGSLCYRAQDLTDIPMRSVDEQETCDNYQIGEKMDFYDFNCALKIYDDKKFSILFVHNNDAYFINKESGNVEYKFYEFEINEYDIRLAHDQSDDTTEFLLQFDECFNKKNFIPNDLPISFEFSKRNSHIELLAHYEGVYDYYEISWEGKYCYRALGVNGRPNRTLEEQKSECDHRPLSTNLNYGQFECGFDMWTPENESYAIFYVTQVIEGGLGSNAYIINKSTNKVRFYDFKSTFTAGSIFEKYKLIDPEIAFEECLSRMSDLPKDESIKFDLQAHDANVVVMFGYQNKLDYFELSWNDANKSESYFKVRLNKTPERQFTNLLNKYDSNEFEFKCPCRVIKDEEFFILVIHIPDSNTDWAYVYLINKLTFEVNLAYYPYFDEAILTVPISNRNSNPQFNSQIDYCVNQKNLLPESLATMVNITRISAHIQLAIHYDGKFDYYGINQKGLTCYVDRVVSGTLNKTTAEAVEECDWRDPTQCIDCLGFKCGFEVLRSENDHYIILVTGFYDFFGATFIHSSANVYFFDESTNDIHFREYSPYNEKEISVPLTESDKNNVYVAEFEECLNAKNALLNDLPIEFTLTTVNSHINILVYDNGKYDYYELNVRGEGCFTAVRMDTDPTRTAAEQMDCDSRRIHRPLKPYIEEYKPQFNCGYEVSRNDTFIFVFIRSTDGVYSYEIDRTTGIAELYLYEILNEAYDDQVNKCAKRKYLSDFKIPLEVTKKPKDLADGTSYLEILVKHEGKYDVYVTEESGYVRYAEQNLPERPNLSLADYLDKIECIRNTYYRVYNIRNFHCPIKVIENENYVNISINAFHNENVYIIDKSSSSMKHVVVKDNLILSNLPVPDANLNYIADVDECISKILNTTGSSRNPFPVNIVRNKDFIEIIVKFNGTYDVYKTTDDGRGMCNISLRSEKLQAMETSTVLADHHPECVSCNGPAFIFTCPDVQMNEEESFVNLDISHGPGVMMHSYTLVKSTGELFYDENAILGPPSISNTIKSLIG